MWSPYPHPRHVLLPLTYDILVAFTVYIQYQLNIPDIPWLYTTSAWCVDEG
jgi:hypothetical protein